MPVNIKGVIFDLDGTLLHTIEDIAMAANKLMVSLGRKEHSSSQYLQWIGNGAARLIQRALGEELEKEQLRSHVAEFKEIYARHLHDQTYVYKGIPHILNVLEKEGVPMAILSNKPHLLTRQVVTHYLPHWHFVEILGQREEVPRKPDPAAALEIASIMQLKPGEILFIGDSNTDILTARAAGMVPLAVSWGYGRLDTEAVEGDYRRIEHPEQILEFVLNK